MQHQNSRMDCQKGSVSKDTPDNKSAARGSQNEKAQNNSRDQNISIDGFDSSDAYQLPPLPGQLDRPRKPKKNQEMGQADDFTNVNLSCETTQISVSKSEQADSNIDTKEQIQGQNAKGQKDKCQGKSESDSSDKGQEKGKSKKEITSIDWNDLIETEENGHQLQKSSAETENKSVAGNQQKRQAGKNQISGSKSSLDTKGELQSPDVTDHTSKGQGKNKKVSNENMKSEPEKGKLLDLKSEEIVKKKEAKQKLEEQAVVEAIRKPSKEERHVQINEDITVRRDDSNYYSVNREMKRQQQRSVSR